MSDQLLPAMLIFGVPGAGKGTQSEMLKAIPDIFHLSSGAIFRALDPESKEAEEVRQYSSKGELVPDELTIRIWRKWVDNALADGTLDPTKQILLLDGIPRNANQCKILDDHVNVLKVIHLAAEDDEPMVERIKQRALKEGRSDDADENIIRRRFEVYREESLPVLSHYQAELKSDVDPTGTPEEVQDRVVDCITPVLESFRGTTSG
jgi:adenylate kinase